MSQDDQDRLILRPQLRTGVLRSGVERRGTGRGRLADVRPLRDLKRTARRRGRSPGRDFDQAGRGALAHENRQSLRRSIHDESPHATDHDYVVV